MDSPRADAVYPRIAPQAAKLYASGLSISGVAAELGVSRSCVDKALEFAEVPKRPPGRLGRTRFDTDRMAGLRADGQSFSAIAEKLGCSPSTVGRHLETRGLHERRERPGPSPRPARWSDLAPDDYIPREATIAVALVAEK